MANKFIIHDKAFIPEGMEFKEEYLEKGMAMYRTAKRKILLRKICIAASVVVSVITTGIFFYDSAGVKGIELVQNEQKVSTTIDTSKSQEQPDTRGLTKETNNSTNNSAARNGLNAVIRDERESAPILSQDGVGQSKMTNDHGSPTSSGVGLPDQKSKSIVSVNKDETLVHESVLQTEPVVAIPNVSEKSISQNDDSHFVVEDDLIITKQHERLPASLISLPGIFKSDLKRLQRPDVIPVLKWQRLIPYLQVGLNPWSDFGGNARKIKSDLNVVGGVDYKLHGSFVVSAAARYFQISGLAHPYAVNNTTYGQGFNTSTQTFYTDRLHYGGLQLSLKKNWNRRHEMSIGYGLDYLLGANNRIATSSVSSYENKELGTVKANGYTEGFVKLNHSISLGYQYWLGKNKAVGMTYQFGLSDIAMDKYFTVGTKDRNSMLSVYFRMNLWR